MDCVKTDEECGCGDGGAGGTPVLPALDPKEGILVRSKPNILIGNIINKFIENGVIVYELDDFTLVKPVITLTNNAPVMEVGDTRASVIFNGTDVQGSFPIVTRVLTPDEGVDMTVPFTFTKTNVKRTTIGIGQSHTFQVTDDHGNVSTVINGVLFKYGFYQGFNSLATLDQTAIKALANKTLVDSILNSYGGVKTYVVPGSPAGPKYLYWCGAVGTPTITGAILNGLPLPLQALSNVNVTNPHDGSVVTAYWVVRTAVRFDAGSYDISLF